METLVPIKLIENGHLLTLVHSPVVPRQGETIEYRIDTYKVMAVFWKMDEVGSGFRRLSADLVVRKVT